jgi:hypothetical protein
MFIIFLLTGIELLIFILLYPVDEIMQYLFIVINSAFVIGVLIQKFPKQYTWILLTVFLLRIVLLLIDYNHLFPVLHSGADTERFNRYASINAENDNYELISTNYGYVLTWLYTVLGNCRLIAQYINVLFGLGVLICLYKIFNTLQLNEKIKKRGLLIAAFFPTLIILSGILLREALCQFFITVSLYYFIKWMKQGESLHIILSVICVLFAAWMHSGCIVIIGGYLMALAFYRPGLKKSKISFVSIVFMFFIFSSILFLLIKTSVFIEHFEGLGEEKIVHTSEIQQRLEAGSAYLTWANPNSVSQTMLIMPLKMIYFLFSPIPFDWRGLQDIVAFILDSIFYLYFVFYILKHYKNPQNKLYNSILKYLTIVTFVFVFIFGYGTMASGTAMRHRCKLFPIVLTMYALSIPDKKSNKSINY